MRTVELIERRRLLIGMGTLAIGGVVAKGATGPRAIKRPAAPSTWAAATRPASEEEGRWTPVSPFERTILGALPPGAEATVRLRGAWGPLPWLNALGEGVHGERPRALAVARPVVQLLSADGRRELRRVAITQGSIAVSAPEGCQVVVASTVASDQLARPAAAGTSTGPEVQARLSVSAPRKALA